MSIGEPVVSDVFRLTGSLLEGRFRVERPIAEGGFGVVYKAEQAALDRPVALKVLKTPLELGPMAQEQFLQVFATEAKTIARITHSNIVQVYDFGVSLMPSGARAGWMALEWLTGVTLEEELLRRRGLGGRSPVECLALMRPILSALSTVHAAGVAHRDLKPSNIMLVWAKGGYVPKLLDFGIAKIMGSEEEGAGTGQTVTRSRQVAFSPAYASPEQVSHGRTGQWTDVHALSLILTEVLTDHPPFSAEDMTTLFRQILDVARPAPRRFGVTVGPWEGILSRAAAIAPEDRYKDAGALLDALLAVEGDATHAYAVSPEARTSVPTSMRSPDTMLAMTRKPAAGLPPPSPMMLEDTIVTPARRSWAFTALGVVTLLTIGAAVAVVRSGAPHGPTSAAPSASSVTSADSVDQSAPRPPVTGAPEPVPVPVAAPLLSASSAPPIVSRAATPPHVKHPSASAAPSAPPPPAAPRVNCDPPFTVDAVGNKHYKPECDN